MDYINKLKLDYKNINELIIKNINNITLIYIESLVNQNRINEYILKNIVKFKKIKNVKNIIPSPNVIDINNYNDLKFYLNMGFTIIINNKTIIAVETKEILNSNINEATVESSIIGPKDSLTENIQTNLGLIKRRIKSNHLKNKVYYIGKYTKTITNILYIDNIIKKDILNKILKYFKNINIDGINDISELKTHLNKTHNVFPSMKITERPDVIVKALLNGKIVILLDTSPFALILPSFLVDFINPIDDNYIKGININFLKIIRFICFILSIITPSFYIAITTFNQETIPNNLLISILNQRIGVPFPATLECIITLLLCEILRESDIRFPSNYGSSISVLGALVLGSAAVDAGIVSPIMIIIVAITYISSLIFTDLEFINALRFWRFIFLFISSFYGLYGIGISCILLLIYLVSYEQFNYPYMFPISPFDNSYLKETIINMKNNKRSKLLSKNINKGEL